ncbi:MAG: hypothetical protein D6689_18000 [Deltaproteobacteria bacterium]|nr:MAG: hypothetical protein D6689_18000 [Deltaproteobacteria bacterium]
MVSLLVGCVGLSSGCIITTDSGDEGRFSLTWTLESGGTTITCADAGATGVSTLATEVGTTVGVEDIFSCEAGGGRTSLLPYADYTVVVSVLGDDGTGNEVALGTSMPRNVTLDAPTVDLGDFTFTFAPAVADVLFTVDYGAAGGSNCGGGVGGEGVQDQGTNLVLLGGGACIAATLTVEGVAEVDDICTELAACIENDKTQALIDLEPDTYDLEITGLFDTGSTSVACFRSIDRFEITDGDEDLGVLIVPFDDTDDPAFCATI